MAVRTEGAFIKLRNMRGWTRFLSAMLIGALSAFAFPPLYFFPSLLLGYAALVVLLDGIAEDPRPVHNAAKIGWAYGFGFYLLGLHWIGYPFFVNAEEHAWLMPFAVTLMPAGLALFFATATALCARFWRAGAQRIFLFAGCFAAIEWLRGHILTGFPWNIPGYGWGASEAILQSAAVFGIYGLSLLTLLLGASLVFLAPREKSRWLCYGALAAFLLIWFGGTIRLGNATDGTVPDVHLRIVQPATLQNEKYVREFVPRNWERLMDLSRAPADIEPTHIIWPEAAPPVVLARSEDASRQIADLLGDDRVLITGALRIEETAESRDVFNSLYVIGEGGRILSTYDKFHLVPFGEYLPFESTVNALGLAPIAGGISGLAQGPGPQTLEVPNAPPIGPLICYEVVFPNAVVGETRPGWFVNVTDDSWFGPNAGPAQHLLIARVRAIEEGLPIARAANAGISVIVDGYGRIKARLELGVRGFLDAALPIALAPTPYAQLGDVIFFVLLFGTLGAAFVPVGLRRA
jgi:apolipoprotein N-acyltransferase